jgi:hypothetical protein
MAWPGGVTGQRICINRSIRRWRCPCLTGPPVQTGCLSVLLVLVRQVRGALAWVVLPSHAPMSSIKTGLLPPLRPRGSRRSRQAGGKQGRARRRGRHASGCRYARRGLECSSAFRPEYRPTPTGAAGPGASAPLALHAIARHSFFVAQHRLTVDCWRSPRTLATWYRMGLLSRWSLCSLLSG